MGTHPIFESDFDCLTDEMPASSAAVDGHHPLPNGVHNNFERIDSIRASQKKRRQDEKRNRELSQKPEVYHLSSRPPVTGTDNEGFEEDDTWEEALISLENVPGLNEEVEQLRSLLLSAQFQKSAQLTQLLKYEFPNEKSLDDPIKLSDALNNSKHAEADELNTFLSDEK